MELWPKLAPRCRCLAGILALLLTLLVPAAQAAEEEIYARKGNFRLLGDAPSQFHLAAGLFDLGEKYRAPGGLLEVRFGRKLGFLGPVAGIMGNTDGAFYLFAGGYADIYWRRLAITPLFAVGGYADGESRDLGGVFQLREAVTFAWRFANGVRLGVNLAHISNGRIHNKNPGENEVMFSLSFPL